MNIRWCGTPQHGSAMGFEYHIEGEPVRRSLPTVIEVYHTPADSTPDSRTSIAKYDSISYVGMNNAFYWAFETEDDKKPGSWRIEMAITLENGQALPLTWSFEIGRLATLPHRRSG